MRDAPSPKLGSSCAHVVLAMSVQTRLPNIRTNLFSDSFGRWQWPEKICISAYYAMQRALGIERICGKRTALLWYIAHHHNSQP